MTLSWMHFEELEDETERVREDVESATTREEAIGLANDQSDSLSEAYDRYETACNALQKLADQNNVDADLECLEDVD